MQYIVEEEDETVFSSFLPIRLLPLVQMLFNRCGMEHVRVADIFSSLSCYHFDDDEVKLLVFSICSGTCYSGFHVGFGSSSRFVE